MLIDALCGTVPALAAGAQFFRLSAEFLRLIYVDSPMLETVLTTRGR